MTAVCQCCGQHLASADGRGATTSRATYWVDADVLACCNAAHDDAARRGDTEVGLSHFLIAVARDKTQAVMLASFGLDTRILASVIETELSPPTTRQDTRPLRTSADLRALLKMTQHTAQLYGCACISVRHLILTLVSPPSNWAAARRVSRWFWAARAYPDPAQHHSHGQSRSRREETEGAEPATGSSTEHARLLARLHRQDEVLADMARLIARLEQRTAEPLVTPAIETASTKPDLVKADLAVEDLIDEPPLEPLDNDTDAELEQAGVKRYYLALDDEIVRAPSIGPRTAARLEPHGVTHVKHLLACDPERLSARLGARHLTASRIAAWKNQARLVCTIPWLRGTHAQLLVGAGYASIDKIMSTDRPIVCAAIMQFATTRDGQAILRSGPPPEIDRIMRWIENTQFADPQRAHGARSLLG